MSTDGSVDIPVTFQNICGWLCDVGAYPVSRFVFFCCFVTDALDPELYRFNLDAVRSTAGSNDLMETFGVGLGWLHESGTSAVSDFVFSRLIDADALDLRSSVFAPRFPRRPAFEGGFTNPSYSFSRSPYWLDRINAS